MATIKGTDTYHPEVDLDTRPGHYYVSVVDGNRFALLAGPYDSHAEALANVEKAKKIAYGVDVWSPFYGFGTCRMEKVALPRIGILNNRMGL